MLIMSEKKGFDELSKKVISTDICSRCGACVLVCPYAGVLDYADLSPRLVGECVDCGICLKVCPRYEPQTENLESSVFGRPRTDEESFGIFKRILVARSRDGEVIKKCQDGGVATTLLLGALKSGMIDGAILSGVDPSVPWLPVPKVAITREEIIASAGTRYSFSPNLLAVKEALSKGLKKVALVGTPCEVQAVRMIQQVPLRKYGDAIKFTIGLFCTESFSYEGLMLKGIKEGLGLDLKSVAKVNIKGKVLVSTESGEVYKIPLKEAKEYSETKCQYCTDFSAELADISVGGVGLEGWTLTVLRTDLGVSVFEEAVRNWLLEVKPAEEFGSAMDLLVKLSAAKRKGE